MLLVQFWQRYGTARAALFFFSSLLLSRLEFSGMKFYAPYIRARVRTVAYFCEVVVLRLRTVPIGTALTLRIRQVIRRGAQAMYLGDGADDRGSVALDRVVVQRHNHLVA